MIARRRSWRPVKKEPKMIPNQQNTEHLDDQSQMPANSRIGRNALADRARAAHVNAVVGIQGWGPKLF